MDSETFQLGDIVTLKSETAVKMSVREVSADEIVCDCFNAGKDGSSAYLSRFSFIPQQLVKVTAA